MIHRRYTQVRRSDGPKYWRSHELLVVQLQIHAILDLVVSQRDVVLVDGVPLLQDQLFVSRAGLNGNQLLEVANRVIFVALNSDLLAQTVVDDDLQHVRFLALSGCKRRMKNKFTTFNSNSK